LEKSLKINFQIIIENDMEAVRVKNCEILTSVGSKVTEKNIIGVLEENT